MLKSPFVSRPLLSAESLEKELAETTVIFDCITRPVTTKKLTIATSLPSVVMGLSLPE